MSNSKPADKAKGNDKKQQAPAAPAKVETQGGQSQPAADQSKPEAQAKPTNSKKEKVPGLKISARVEGFRRGGRAWSIAPTVVALEQFTEEQLDQILTEPNLIVSDVEDVNVEQE